MDKAYVIRRSVRKYRHRTAVVYGDLRLTYGQLDERVTKLANGLISLGIKKGDRIGLLLYNSPHYFEVDFACAKCGFVMVPLNAQLAASDHAYMILHSEANTLIFGDEFIDVVNSMVPQIANVKRFICVGKSPEGTISYERLIEGQPSIEPDIEVGEDDLSSIRYTSGTTGKPKGVMITQHVDIAATINLLADNLNPGYSDVMLHTCPVIHTSGAMFLPHFMSGAANVILKEFDPEKILDFISKEKVTAMFLFPRMIIDMIRNPKLTSCDLSSIKLIGYGGAPMPAGPLREALEVFGPVFTQGYGLTEAPVAETLLKREDHIVDGPEEIVARLASAGRELHRVRLAIRDDHGHELPAGEIGEITVKGDHVMKGYWKDPGATAEKLRNGWLRTGDLAFMDDEGYVFIMDKKNDMIISGGFSIYPREVEEAIYSHPSVSQCAVIGVPDDQLGESVKALVVLKDGMPAGEEEIVQHTGNHIASYKKPKSVEFVSEIPVNHSGKVMRCELRKKCLAGQVRKV